VSAQAETEKRTEKTQKRARCMHAARL
jgi:hypothetical protein